ncbi:tetratricopeptide repeat protein [Tuwongella immobilis]|uniref:Glycosyl transferase family 2:: TPR_16 n=1 Tax=Tuwongella immobilis TaxID=692036 RepID=A0A6C2YQZ7_9BACT|nr:tetratricopeptide repeat protein [Tuwongella immobilis]VIP03579.1 glycosyl transferase family 2 : : TPR_16 [Tuwongella immobilis]VTS04526.1 glycosyl transferase family 2 : : TPR_16 [Tuwongella immobilis]
MTRRHFRLLIPVFLVAILGGVVWFQLRSPSAETIAAWVDQAEIALSNQQWKESERLAQLIADSGDREAAQLIAGETAYFEGNLESAFQTLGQIPLESRWRPRASLLAGYAAFRLQQPYLAEQLLTEAIESYPKEVDAFRVLSVIHYDQGNLRVAIEDLQQVATLAPEDARPWRQLGLIHRDFERFPEAEQAYAQAVQRKLPPVLEAEVRQEWADVLVRLARHPEAEAILDAIPPEVPMTAERMTTALAIAQVTQSPEQLDAQLAQAVKQFPRHAPILRANGVRALQRNDPESAVKWLKTATQVDPYDYRNYYELAQAYQRANNATAAKEAESEVKRLQALLTRLTELSEAAMDQPWDAAVRRELATLCRSLGKMELAKQWEIAASRCEQAR